MIRFGGKSAWLRRTAFAGGAVRRLKEKNGLNQKSRGEFVEILLRKFEDSGQRNLVVFENNAVTPGCKRADIQEDKVKDFLSQTEV